MAQCVYIEAAAAGTLQSSNKLRYANRGGLPAGPRQKAFHHKINMYLLTMLIESQQEILLAGEQGTCSNDVLCIALYRIQAHCAHGHITAPYCTKDGTPIGCASEVVWTFSRKKSPVPARN